MKYNLFNWVLAALTFSSLFNLRSQTTGEFDNAQPSFEEGEAQIIEGFSERKLWVKHNLWVETTFDSDADGKLDRMHVFVTRPYQTETQKLKLPVVYVSSPYFSGTGGNKDKYFWNQEHELGATPKAHSHPNIKTKEGRNLSMFFHDKTWVPRGYIMVYSCSPGTGQSDGSPTIGGENETLAPKAVIEWLCGKANGYTSRTGDEKVTAFWSTGKVGMTGTSYNGTLAMAAATTGVDGLEAIIPIAPVTSWYRYYRSNGLVRSPGGYIGEDTDVLYDFVHSGDKSKRASNDERVRDGILVPGQDRTTGDYNDFWDKRDYALQMDKMKAAMLMSHGFNDWNVMPEHSYRIYKIAKEMNLPVQLYYHQNGHGGPPPMEMMNRWFTRYLHGIENNVENDPPVQIVREEDFYPTPYDAYPDEKAEHLKFYLAENGNGIGSLALESKTGQGQNTLIDDAAFKAKKLAGMKKSKNRLLFVTPQLPNDTRISGVPAVNIHLASNKPAVNLSVYLVAISSENDQEDNIYHSLITRGWADPQNHSSLRKGEPLEPGQFYTVSFDLMPDDQIIKKGQQIALMIFSSDPEFTICPKAGTELTIDLDKTWIKIPIVGGESVLAE